MFVCANHSTEHHIKEKEKKTNECTTMSWKLVKNQCVDVWCFSWNYNCSIFNNAHIWVLSSKLAVLFLAERKAMKNIYLNGSVFHYVIITFDVIKWRRELSGIQWWRDILVFCEYIFFVNSNGFYDASHNSNHLASRENGAKAHKYAQRSKYQCDFITIDSMRFHWVIVS